MFILMLFYEINLTEGMSLRTYFLFFQECLKFLNDIHFGGSQNLSGKSFHQSTAVLNLYIETTATFLKVLLQSFGFSSFLALFTF